LTKKAEKHFLKGWDVIKILGIEQWDGPFEKH